MYSRLNLLRDFLYLPFLRLLRSPDSDIPLGAALLFPDSVDVRHVPLVRSSIPPFLINVQNNKYIFGIAPIKDLIQSLFHLVFLMFSMYMSN